MSASESSAVWGSYSAGMLVDELLVLLHQAVNSSFVSAHTSLAFAFCTTKTDPRGLYCNAGGVFKNFSSLAFLGVGRQSRVYFQQTRQWSLPITSIRIGPFAIFSAKRLL